MRSNKDLERDASLLRNGRLSVARGQSMMTEGGVTAGLNHAVEKKSQSMVGASIGANHALVTRARGDTP